MEIKTYEQYKEPLIKLGKKFGFNLNLDEPVTIQDKINWMKLYDSTPLKTGCADKIHLHEYCKEKLGKDLCVPIIAVYDKVEDVKWDELPDRFVIKCNHGSGMNIIIKDKSKMDMQDTVTKLNGFMNDDFAFHVGYEMHYHDIPHKVFVEEYMEDENQKNSLFDYKFWCFNGEPKFYTINDGNGHGAINHYNLKGEYLPEFSRPEYPSNPNKNYPKPKNFDKMIEYSKKLSEDFKFVRVDFYEISGKLYVGELTFTPGAGFFKYKRQELNKTLGDMLAL